MLREQVRKLRDELSISRRLDWIRRGLYGDIGKGAERLQRGFVTVTPASTNASRSERGQYNLDVEINRDGAVKIGTNTTAAPTTPTPRSAEAPPARTTNP